MQLVWVVESQTPLVLRCVDLSVGWIRDQRLESKGVLCFQDSTGSGQCYPASEWFEQESSAREWFERAKRAQVAILKEQLEALEALEFPASANWHAS